MGIGEVIPSWLFQNPIVSNANDVAVLTARQVKSVVGAVAGALAPKPPSEPTLIYMEPLPLWKLAGATSFLIRVAGLSGASAVALGAYGAHAKFDKDDDHEKLKLMFETANKYHFIHTLALFATPLCHYPKLTGSLFVVGMLMFCGTCYYRALSGKGNLRRITPFGGTLLIVAWLSMAL